MFGRRVAPAHAAAREAERKVRLVIAVDSFYSLAVQHVYTLVRQRTIAAIHEMIQVVVHQQPAVSVISRQVPRIAHLARLAIDLMEVVDAALPIHVTRVPAGRYDPVARSQVAASVRP